MQARQFPSLVTSWDLSKSPIISQAKKVMLTWSLSLIIFKSQSLTECIDIYTKKLIDIPLTSTSKLILQPQTLGTRSLQLNYVLIMGGDMTVSHGGLKKQKPFFVGGITYIHIWINFITG